jgi:6-phosphogluconolactonase
MVYASIESIEPKNFAGDVADELVALVEEAVGERGVCRILLSGGTTPGTLYRALSKPPRVEQVPWEKVVLCWGDERHVSHDDPQSNCRMVHETLTAHLPNRPTEFPIPTDNSDPAASAEAYEKTLREVFGGQPVVFDIVLLGLGDDGHTASLFPGTPLLHDSSGRLVAAAPHPKDGSTRVTVMPAVLLAGRRILVLVSGEAKADIVKAVIEGDHSADEYPVCLLRGAAERVTWYIDSGAAKKLTQHS